MKKTIIGILAISLLLLVGCTSGSSTTGSAVADAGDVTVFKSPNCGCCNGHVSAYKQSGFDVDVNQMSNMDSIKEKHNIPANMLSCHTAEVEGYFVEGHVPIEAVEKLLEERPDIDGIALPGMPSGTPGMPGQKRGTWTIYAIKDGETSVFMEI